MAKEFGELLVVVLFFMLIFSTLLAIGLTKTAGRKAPHPYEHSCNCGLTDEEVKELIKEDE